MTIHSFLLLSFHCLLRCYTEDGFTVAFSSLDDFFSSFLKTRFQGCEVVLKLDM